MKRIIDIAKLFCLVTVLGLSGCGKEEVLPATSKLDAAASGLLGTWKTEQRTVEAYQKNSAELFVDTTYTEKITLEYTFSEESVADNAQVIATTYKADGSVDKTTTAKGRWVGGEISNPDGPVKASRYLVLMETATPHKAETGYYRTYTIVEQAADRLVLSYTETNSKAENSRKYTFELKK